MSLIKRELATGQPGRGDGWVVRLCDLASPASSLTAIAQIAEIAVPAVCCRLLPSAAVAAAIAVMIQNFCYFCRIKTAPASCRIRMSRSFLALGK